jgi:hypothetical protein
MQAGELIAKDIQQEIKRGAVSSGILKQVRTFGNYRT